MYQQYHFKENLIHWFDENQREMPWRQTTNPFYIWLSEVMLADRHKLKQLLIVIGILNDFQLWKF